MENFMFYSESTLEKFVGREVKWLDLYGKVRTGVLSSDKKRTFVPEACNPYATTVLLELPHKSC